jgi:hypothetical protein
MSCIEGVCYLGTPLAPSRPARPRKGRRGIGGVDLAPAGSPAHGDHPDETSCPAAGTCDGCGPSCGCAPCRETHGVPVPAAGVPLPPRPALRPRLVLAPAGALDATRPWAMLSLAERRDLYGLAIDRAIDTSRGYRPAGNPPAPTPNADELPAWAREAGITQTTWNGMNVEAREAARQRHVSASGQGWQTAQAIVNQGVSVVNQVLRGDLERDLERIRQQGNLNAQQQQAAAAQFVAQTNLRIAELNAAAAANPAQAQQFQQAISAMQAAQQQAQGQQTTQLATILQQMRETTNAISPTTVMVGVGILGALGLGAVALLRR